MFSGKTLRLENELDNRLESCSTVRCIRICMQCCVLEQIDPCMCMCMCMLCVALDSHDEFDDLEKRIERR